MNKEKYDQRRNGFKPHFNKNNPNKNQQDQSTRNESKREEHERNYSTHDLELDAIVHALNMWMHYLMGNRFELRIGHSGMKYLFEQPTLNVMKTIWMEFLSEYDIEIKHIKGKENKFLNALDIRVHLMHTTTIRMHQSNLNSIILDVVVTNQHYLYVKESLQQENVHQNFKG